MKDKELNDTIVNILTDGELNEQRIDVRKMKRLGNDLVKEHGPGAAEIAIAIFDKLGIKNKRSGWDNYRGGAQGDPRDVGPRREYS